MNPRQVDYGFHKRQLTNYFLIAETKDATKLPILLNSLGRDGLDIFDGLAEPKTTYDEAIDRLDNFFTGKTSVLLRRKEFYQARQAPNESITEYAVS